MSEAVEKSSKSGTGRDTKETRNREKGCVLEVPHVEIVEKAHIEATQANPYLVSIGFSMMGGIVTACD